MKLGGIRKALIAAFPLVAAVAGHFGFDVTLDWWNGVVVAVTPLLVWWIANNEDSSL